MRINTETGYLLVFSFWSKAIFSLGPHFESPTPASLKLESTTFKHFEASHRQLDLALKAMYSMAFDFFPKDNENQINIKLPTDMSLTHMSHIIGEIDFVFNKMQALRKINDNRDFMFTRVESGSVWIILLASIPSAVITVGAIVKIAMDIKRRLLDDEVAKQRIRVLSSGASVIESLEKEMTDVLKKECIDMAKHFTVEHKLELNPEEESTLAFGFERLGKLLYQGIEIYASIEAPDATKAAFPSLEVPSLLSIAKPLLNLPKPQVEE